MMMHLQGILISAALLSLVLVAAGCSAVEKTEQPPLRVGVAPDYPPIIGKKSGVIAGLEADFARKLAKALERPLEFVEIRRGKLISALYNQEYDIIMSGMSVTRGRELRLLFTDPYHGTALMALTRIKDEAKFDTPDKIMTTSARIGFQADTTADIFVRRNCPNAQKITVSNPDNAAYMIKRGALDLFINDAYSIAFLATKHEADLVGIWTPLQEDDLAWGVRRTDVELLNRVNDILKSWKEDGTLERTIRFWVPFYDKTKDWGTQQ